MALINELKGIGDAIREKTGGTELIPLKEMASAIKNIVSGDYNDGYADGVASVQNPLEYATVMQSVFQEVAFPDGYNLIITLPNCKQFFKFCYQATGLKTITLKELTEETAINFNFAFRESTAEIIDFDNKTIKVSIGVDAFRKANMLKQIKGTLDLTETTSVTNMFECNLLEEVRFKANSIKLSIVFFKSPLLSSETVQSIVDGLATVETAQTLTLHRSIVLTDEQKSQILSKNWTLVQ